MKSGVYLVRCNANGNCYVGSSKNIAIRWNEHRNDLRRNQHYNSHWQRAWRKYGESQFEWIVLEEVEAIDSLLRSKEQHWIDILRPGFNVSLYAFPTRLGAVNSKSHRAKIANGQRAKWASLSEDERSKRMESIKRVGIANAKRFALLREKRNVEKENSRIAKEKHLVARAKLRQEWEVGRAERQRIGAEKRRKIALAYWAKPEYRAKHKSAVIAKMQDPEVLRRLSESHKGRVLSEEQKRKIGDAHRGMKRAPEVGRKISAAKMGHPVSEETRRKISETKRRKKSNHLRLARARCDSKKMRQHARQKNLGAWGASLTLR